MPKARTDETEVVKIRISTTAKLKLQDIAKKEYRTFADQCRLSLDEWIEFIKNKKK